MGETESMWPMKQESPPATKTLPFPSGKAQNRAQFSPKNLYDCPISRQSLQLKLHDCTVSEKARCATYIYMFGQKLTERPQKVHLHD
jgi:hypothetical protein